MWIVAIFAIGYLAIVLEHPLQLNKAASALLAGALCWTAYILGGDHEVVNEQLVGHLGDLSQVLFFLLGAMTIVELIDAHDGFEIITSRITTRSRRKLLVIITLLAFFLSAVLDNLTTSIVMMSLVRRLVPDDVDRRYYAGIVIVAANAGGAWSPIGDVTTTMLWVGNQVTTYNLVTQIFLPAVVSLVVPAVWVGARLKGDLPPAPEPTKTARSRLPGFEAALLPELADHAATIKLPADAAATGRTLAELNLEERTGANVVSFTPDGGEVTVPVPDRALGAGDTLVLGGSPDAIARAIAYLVTGQAPEPTRSWERTAVFFAGTGALLFVPAFKTLTHLPPFMGILVAVGVLWALTEIIHKGKHDELRGQLTVAGALQRIDSQSILFFLGILLAIAALESAGFLSSLAHALDQLIGNVNLITIAIGLSSSVVDNVPLVAAAQGMYTLATFPTDHPFWLFLAYCAGTGGSILIIGSAAGIAVMGIQRITFGWYVRHMSLPVLLGYLAGAGVYVAITQI